MQIESPATRYDVVVIGAGLVGATFAVALASATGRRPTSILMVEQRPLQPDNAQDEFDARSTALAFSSREIYQDMGLWPSLEDQVTAIRDIHVSDRGRFGSIRLSHTEQQSEALGYVIENHGLGQALNQMLLASDRIGLLCPATIRSIRAAPGGMSLRIQAGKSLHQVESALVVLADGGKSPLCAAVGIEHRIRNYRQHALIANVAFESAHDNIAHERFTRDGPLAILPLAPHAGRQRGALVWTVAQERSEEFMAMADARFLECLQEAVGERPGRLTRIGKRFCYPLSLTVAREQIRPGLVLLGNVAHTLHPVAGQGLNLALRDVAALVATLNAAVENGEAPGSMAVLQRYLEQRQSDQRKAIAFTDYLVRLFSSDDLGKIWIRKAGLAALDLLPALRREFAGQAMGIR